MAVLKYLLLMALAVIVWWGWQKRTRPRAVTRQPEAPPERMVTCACCGVYLPQSEALAERERYYCCETHRKAGPEASL